MCVAHAKRLGTWRISCCTRVCECVSEGEREKEGTLKPVVLTTVIFLSMVNVAVLHHIREWCVKPVLWYSVII